MTEKTVFHVNGYLGLIIAIALLLIGGWCIWLQTIVAVVLGVILIIVALVAGSSLTIIAPNEAKTLTFFGQYVGTIRQAGLFMTIPLTNKASVSLRVRNFNSSLLKVNDLRGNPAW